MDWLIDNIGILVRGHQFCTQFSIFEGNLAELLRFWCCQLQKMRKPRRIASFLVLSSSKIEEISLIFERVSQNCFVFDVANFKNKEILQNCFGFYVIKLENWGGLAELLYLWWCQISNAKIEEISQNSIVFKFADR